MKTWLFVGSTVLLLVLGAVAAAAWQGAILGLGGSAEAQEPVIVGIDMDPTGNSCPNDGTNCTLGEIEPCVETSAGATIQFDVFLDSIPSGESYLVAGYDLGGWPGTLEDPDDPWMPLPHMHPLVNLTAQPLSSMSDLSDNLPDSSPPYSANIVDLGAAEYNPPFTGGVLGRYALDLTGVSSGVYPMTLTGVVIGRDVPPAGDLCLDYGCDIWDGNFSPQYGLIAVDTACPGAVVEYTLTMAANPSQGGTTDPSPGTHDYPEDTVVAISATPNAGWQFDGWSGHADCSDGSVTMNANKSCTANFSQIPVTYTLTMAANPSQGGTTDPSPGTHDYPEDTVVAISATPNAGWQFDNWSGHADCSDGSVTMNANKSCTANFSPISVTYTLTMAASPSEGGTTDPAPGSHEYPADTVVAISATPNAGWQFDNWSGDSDCSDGSVTMNANKSCTANFSQIPITYHTLTMVVNPSEGGTTDPSPGTHDYPEDTVVAISATPNPGWQFDGWSGNPDCSDGSVKMNRDKSCTADFSQIPVVTYTLTMAANPSEGGTTDPSPGTHDYPEDTVVAISATPNAGWQFDGWSGHADCSDGSVTMNADKSCTADFSQIPVGPYTLTMAANPSEGGTTDPSPGTHEYPADTVVAISATPNAGWQFDNWSGDSDCSDGSVTMNADKSCTANFSQVAVMYTLTMATDPTWGGTTDPSPGTHDYPEDTVVALSATAYPGWQFDNWSGDSDCSDGSVTMNADKSCTANFSPTGAGVTVEIDIKPCSYPNSINPNSKGVLPVAVLTTAEFDASTLDPDSAVFAGAPPKHYSLKDVDDDGDDDLMFHFRTQLTDIVAGVEVACLQGLTYGGILVQGCDAVRTVPPDANIDGDWFSDDVEASVGTDQLAACPDESDSDTWPPDINLDDNADIVDVLLFRGHVPSNLDDAEFEPRLDLNLDGTVNVIDVVELKPFLNTSCPQVKTDTDGDGKKDGVDKDDDNDGFTDIAELHVNTGPLRACGVAAWPPDLNDTQDVNILDVALFKPVLGTEVGDSGYKQRYDLNADKGVNILDVALYKPLMGTSCTNP